MWFWTRDDPEVPLSVRQGLPAVIPDATWGEPEARMPTDTCDWNTHFNAHSIIFDLTFCVRISLLDCFNSLTSNYRAIGPEILSHPQAVEQTVLTVSLRIEYHLRHSLKELCSCQ